MIPVSRMPEKLKTSQGRQGKVAAICPVCFGHVGSQLCVGEAQPGVRGDMLVLHTPCLLFPPHQQGSHKGHCKMSPSSCHVMTGRVTALKEQGEDSWRRLWSLTHGSDTHSYR